MAWLCRACHTFVHGLAGHEELARELFTVERLLGREEVRRWSGVGGEGEVEESVSGSNV